MVRLPFGAFPDMSIRMKDIAEDLGVSVVTVSKVLRNHSDISTATKRRVLNRMKELNYQPNLAARALVTGRSSTMGLIVPDLVYSFFAEVALGLSRVLRKRGYGLIVSSSEEDPELERAEIDNMLAHRVDALFLASTQTDAAACLKKLESRNIQYVLIDRTFAGQDANFVGVDDVQVGRIATGHLIGIGRRKVAYLGGRHVSPAAGRLEGYRQALADHGIKVPSSYVVIKPHTDNSAHLIGYEAMKHLLRLNPRPDAVVCGSDPLAMGAMKAALESGIAVPKEIAFTGAGNATYSGLLRVPLTTVDQQSTLIGQRAAKLALACLERKGPAKTRTVLLEPKLVARESTVGAGPSVGTRR